MALINIRTDPETDKALAILTAGGTTRSAAIRQAILAAARDTERQRLRSEAAAVAADPADREEIQRVQTEMDALRAW